MLHLLISLEIWISFLKLFSVCHMCALFPLLLFPLCFGFCHDRGFLQMLSSSLLYIFKVKKKIVEALWGDSPSFGGPTDSPLTFSPGIHKWPCVGEQGGAGEGFTGQYTVSLHFQSQGSASTHLCLFPSPVSDLGSAETVHTYLSHSLACARGVEQK